LKKTQPNVIEKLQINKRVIGATSMEHWCSSASVGVLPTASKGAFRLDALEMTANPDLARGAALRTI